MYLLIFMISLAYYVLAYVRSKFPATLDRSTKTTMAEKLQEHKGPTTEAKELVNPTETDHLFDCDDSLHVAD